MRQALASVGILVLLASACLHAQEWSIEEALINVELNRGGRGEKFPKPRAGETKYGLTYYESKPPFANDQQVLWGWCRIVEQGTTECRERKPEPNKPASKQRPYTIWLCAWISSSDYLSGPTEPVKGGKMMANAQKFLDDLQSGWKLTEKEDVPVGDGGWVAVDRMGQQSNATQVILKAVSKRLRVTVYMQSRIQVGTSHYDTPERLEKQLNSPGYSYVWTDVAGLAAKFRAAEGQRKAQAIDLAQKMFQTWNAWASRPLGSGPDFKGLYYDVKPYVLDASEMPAGVALKNESKTPLGEPNRIVERDYAEKAIVGGNEANKVWYRVGIEGFLPHHSKPVDHSIGEAKAKLAELPRTRLGGIAGKIQQVELRGADEAVLVEYPIRGADGVLYRTDPYVFARRSNAVITVTGWQLETDLERTRSYSLAIAQRVLDKMSVQPGSTGTVGTASVQLNASPSGLWADGKSTSRLRLTVRDAAGKGLPAQFQLAARGGGTLGAETLTTNADGVVEVDYTAGTVPGASTITAAGVAGTCSATICEGGLSIAPAQEGQWSVRADGTSSLPIVIRGTGPDGKPLAGLRVSLSTEEKELPQRGTLTPVEIQLDASGVAQSVYTPPLIAAGSGFRLGNIYVNASAQAAGPPPASLTGQIRLTVNGGEGATLFVQKDGFATASFPVSLAAANSLLRGRLLARAPGGETFPLACASLRVVGADGKQGIGAGQSDADGAFSFECVTSQQGGAGEATDLPAALEVPLDPALLVVFNGARESLNELNADGFEVAAAARYLGGASERLARCDPKGDPGQRPAAIAGAAYRLGLLSVYIRLIRARQLEDLDWFMDSVDPVIDELVGLVVDISELEKQAKEKLGEKFNQVVWQRFKKTAVVRVLRMLNVWYRKQTKTLRDLDKKIQAGQERDKKFNEAIGRTAEEGGEDSVTASGLLHTFVEPLDALTPELKLPDPDGGAAVDLKTWFLKSLKKWLRKPLEDELRAQAQGVLNTVVRRFEKAGADESSLESATGAARELFTSYQDAHLKLNIRNLDAELYRLDAKLFMDTVVKGVVIYLDARKTIAEAGVKALRGLTNEQFEKIQESVTAGGEKVDRATQFLDGAFRVYQGQAWLRDAFHAGSVIEAIAGELVK